MGIMDIGAGKSGASSELILHQGLTAATTGDRISIEGQQATSFA